MKGGAAAGFTIVETLIVLAVSMAIFVSAAGLISGRQRQTAFDTSIRNLQTQLQQVVGTVSSGQYNLPDNVKCTVSGNAASIFSGGTGQGTSQGCVFVGKALQFNVGTAEPEQFYVYTMYGLQDFTSAASLDLKQAGAKVITPTESSGSVDISNLQYGLHAYSMKYNGSSTSAVAVVTNTASFTGGDGSQQLNIVPISGTGAVNGAARDGNTAASTINTSLKNNVQTVNPASGVQICFASGGTNQSGLITLGGAGQTGVTLKIYNNGTCA